jgi:2,6-dihydroxypseudooxynicotine hydrolase
MTGNKKAGDGHGGVLRNESDRAKLDGFIHEMDLSLRLIGAETMADRNVFVRAARYSLFTRSDFSEMTRLLKGLSSYGAWPTYFGTKGTEELERAENAESAGQDRTAASRYLRAAGLFHAGQINLLSHNPQKAILQRKSSEAYRKGAPLYRWPAKSVTFATTAGSAYAVFRTPEGEGPFPCVVMVNGANSIKEEVHYFADYFLERGMATFVIEAPGQGEAGMVRGGGRLRIEEVGKVLAEAVDWVTASGIVDTDALGLWGLSWGGFLALHSFPELPQIKAAISLGGFYDLRKISRLSPWLLEEFCTLLGFESFDEVKSYVQQEATLAGRIEKVDRPYLVVHGGLDDLLDLDEVDDMVGSPFGELWNYEHGVHCCYNYGPEVGPRMADWMLGRLVGDRLTQKIGNKDA